MQESDLYCFDCLPSTNLYAMEHYDELPDGALIVARTQTGGRGRLGRHWVSPDGGLYASFVMKQLDPEHAFHATITGSLAALDTMKFFCPEGNFYIKWPNDIYSGMSKCAGLLSECVLRNGKPSGVIVGLGINVNLTAEELSESKSAATSMKMLSNHEFSLKKVMNRLEKSLKECYISYLNFPERLFDEWVRENRLVGRKIGFVLPDGSVIRGLFQGIADDGEAIVHDGVREYKLGCGDATVLKESWLS